MTNKQQLRNFNHIQVMAIFILMWTTSRGGFELVNAHHQLGKRLCRDKPDREEAKDEVPVKVFPHIIITIMAKDELYQSLLSSSARYNPERRDKSDEGEDLRRLKRKILPSLPEQKASLYVKQQKKWFCFPTFNPQSTFIIVWQIINIFLIYIYFMEIPMALAFGNHRSGNQLFFMTINYPVIGFFLIDMVISLNTSFYQDGQLQTDSKKITKNYLKNYLVFDAISLAAVFAYEMIETYDLSKEYSRIVFIIFFVRFKQLFKLERIIINSFDLNRRVKALIKLLLLLSKILLICNILACFGFLISRFLWENNVIYDPRPSPTCGQSAYWIVSTCEAGVPLVQLGFVTQYIYSLYWAATTMISIGYGDITPKNSYEIGFTIFMQFLSCLLYGYAINQIWSIIQELNSKKYKIHTRLNTINTYMRDKQIDSDLKNRINGYLNSYYYSKNLRKRELQYQIISELTPSLKRQLYYGSYSIVLKHKFFTCIHEEVIISACQFIQQIYCYQDEDLLDQFSISPSLYYLKKGELKQETGQKTKLVLQSQFKGDYVGLYEFITQLGFLSNLTATKYTSAYYLKFNDWRLCLMQNQQCFEHFYLVRERILLYQQLQSIGYQCYFCAMHNHRSQLCLDHFLRNVINKQYQLTQKYEDQQRKPYIRRKFLVHFTEKKQRKRSYSKVRESGGDSEIEKHNISVHSIKRRDSSIYQDLYLLKKKISIEPESELKRGGKIFGRHIQRQWQQKHHKALQKAQKIKQIDEIVQSESSELQIKLHQYNLDELANYDQYYPLFNPSEFVLKQQQRRRITKSFYD